MIKVAIVEDNKNTREGFEILINQTPGCQCVCTCATVTEALRKIPKALPDIVLMDIQLRDRSGIECTAQLKQLLPLLQIIIITAYEDSEHVVQALRAGACGYLLKRSSPERVIAAILEVQEGGVPMTPVIARTVVGQFQSQDAARTGVEKLSAREKEVLKLVIAGLGNKAIAGQLNVTVAAVKWHIQHIYTKLGVHSRTEAALKFRAGKPNDSGASGNGPAG